jgi:hypothetical protein
VWIDLDLSHDGDDAAIAPGPAQRILNGLLDHVSNPAGGACDENAKRQWRHFAPRNFVSHQLITNLWTIAVDDADVPSLVGEIHNRRKTFTGVAELIGDRGSLARRRQCVAA